MIDDQRETGCAVFSSQITLLNPLGRLPSPTTHANEAVICDLLSHAFIDEQYSHVVCVAISSDITSEYSLPTACHAERNYMLQITVDRSQKARQDQKENRFPEQLWRRKWKTSRMTIRPNQRLYRSEFAKAGRAYMGALRSAMSNGGAKQANPRAAVIGARRMAGSDR